MFQPLLRSKAVSHQLVNRTRGFVLATRVETAFDSRSRRRGLLGRRALAADTMLAIAPSNAVHTFGMRFPIDVLFVARDGRVVKRVVSMRARRIAGALRAFAALEFGAAHDGVARTQVGDVLAFEETAPSSEHPARAGRTGGPARNPGTTSRCDSSSTAPSI